ncbi:hypothetical protein D9M72_622460 [compost metagenome]
MPSLDDRDNATTADTGFNEIAAEGFQLFFDKARRLVNVIKKFGILVQMTTPCGDLRLSLDGTIEHWHFGNILRFL